MKILGTLRRTALHQSFRHRTNFMNYPEVKVIKPRRKIELKKETEEEKEKRRIHAIIACL